MSQSESQSPKEKFTSLLRELFEFDCADLDFGIYRIMNYKRQVIEKWIKEALPRTISDELQRGVLDAQEQAQASAARSRTHEALETAVYNHLYTFFSRYWQDGDFISKRRYSKKERYAIPYNGEEVYLYWANHDQYYVKTGEYFTDYSYKAPNGVTVHFKLQQADVEQNNVKGEKRFFLPVLDGVAWDETARTLTIPFKFRPLTERETIAYGQKNQQEDIIAKALKKIPERVKEFKAPEALAALLTERRKTEKDVSVSLLEHHLRQYTRRNTSDFFIHKDLRGFLSRELDFYLKNEVLNLDELEAAGEHLAEGWFQLVCLIKRVGRQIIDFLAQIEDFQKMLWEKKKFITETFYVVTVGNIRDTFYPEIADCEAQWEEWEKLGMLNDGWRNMKAPERSLFLKQHSSLPLDTRHFSQDFVDRLLASFDNLDELIDGLLVHSENWQALNLLMEKYRGRVQCIYIDPPFNTGTDHFLYKDGYSHSSWLSMMDSRIQLGKHFLPENGTLYVHIDYAEKERLKLMLDRHLYYITEIIWRIGWVSGYKSKANKFIRNHDTIYQYGKSETPFFVKTYIPYPEGYTRRDGTPPEGPGYPLEDTWNCSEIDQLNSIQIMSFSKEKIGEQMLTQKNENLIARMIKSSSKEGQIVMDYFLGSGTTTAVAQKMGRRYIGIEVGEHFYKYALVRMKRVLYGDPYGISPEVSWKGGGIFKVIRLESYEDALNNLTFDDANGQKALDLFKDDYLLHYMLKWETRHSETLLNVEKLQTPFAYKLRLHRDGETRERLVDLPETFNYLLGLDVQTRKVYYLDVQTRKVYYLDVQTRKVYYDYDKGRRYLIYRGALRNGRTVAIIWRETQGWTKEDYEHDRNFVTEHILADGADEIFVNGDSLIPGAQSLDPIFKERMFAGVEV